MSRRRTMTEYSVSLFRSALCTPARLNYFFTTVNSSSHARNTNSIPCRKFHASPFHPVSTDRFHQICENRSCGISKLVYVLILLSSRLVIEIKCIEILKWSDSIRHQFYHLSRSIEKIFKAMKNLKINIYLWYFIDILEIIMIRIE